MEYAFVTGATGLVGSNLCKTLVEKGYKVKALVRKLSDKTFLDSISVECVEADLIDEKSKLKELLKGIDVVFHCAAQVRALDIIDNEHFSTNVRGTKNILEASLYNSVKKFVYVSTLGVMGIMKDHHRVREDMPMSNSREEIPYYDTKIDAEKLVLNYYNDKNLPVVILRPGFIYGPRDRNGLPEIIPFILRKQSFYIGHGNNIIATTSVKNLNNAMLLAAKTEESTGKIYNITDGIGITQKDFVRTLSEILEVDEPRLRFSVSVANRIAKINQAINNESPLNEYAVALISNDFDFDISKARKELGYFPQDNFKKDMREAVEWYLINHTKDVKEAKSIANKTDIIKYSAIFSGILALFILINKRISQSEKK